MIATERIAILLAEDHEIVRAGLKSLLAGEPGIEVLGEASTGREAVEMATRLRPSIVVMDIAMPMLNGLEATRQILHAVPNAKVLILSAHNDDAYVDRAMAVGAAGYLTKQSAPRVLLEAIREIQKGKIFLCQAVAKRYQRRNKTDLDRAGRLKRKALALTSRESEVLQLIAEGQANKQIAAELGISVKTVEKHRNSLMRKLDIHDTASLTRHAVALGIIDCEIQLAIPTPSKA